MKVTMDGKDGVKLMQIVAPHHAIPIHYNDYTVFKPPLSDFEGSECSRIAGQGDLPEAR